MLNSTDCSVLSSSSHHLKTEEGTRLCEDGVTRDGIGITDWRTLRIRFWQALPGHEMHDCGLAGGQPEGRQGYVAVEEATLIDESQDLRAGHRLLRPVWNR